MATEQGSDENDHCVYKIKIGLWFKKKKKNVNSFHIYGRLSRRNAILFCKYSF